MKTERIKKVYVEPYLRNQFVSTAEPISNIYQLLGLSVSECSMFKSELLSAYMYTSIDAYKQKFNKIKYIRYDYYYCIFQIFTGAFISILL